MANRLFDSLFDEKEDEYGLPAGYLRPTALIESNLNPRAQAPTSSAGGLFQFIDSTANQYGLRDKRDPVASTDAAARLARDNAAILTRRLGREPTREELYIAHQQGAGGAAALLSNPDAPAHTVVGMRAVKNNGGDDATTAGDLTGKFMSRFQRMAGDAGDTGGYQTDAAQSAWQARRAPAGDNVLSGGDSDETLAGGSGSDTLRPRQPQGPTFADTAGNLIGALGRSLLTSPRNNPFAGLPAALDQQEQQRLRQQEAQARQAQLQYGMQRDARQEAFDREKFDFSKTNVAADNARAERTLELQGRTDAAKYAYDSGLKPGDSGWNKKIEEFYKAKTAPNTPADIQKYKFDMEQRLAQGKPLVSREQWEKETNSEANKPLPAEMAGRLGMADEFFRRYDVIRPKIAEGAITGPIEGPWARNNVGAPGALMSDLKVGSEALFRMLTGAGSGPEEARKQADQYLPSMTDSKEKALDKADRLRDVLRSTQRSALTGRMPQEEIDKKFPSFEGSGTNRYNEKPGQSSASPPPGAPPGAKQGNDGNYYVPDPARPGKFLRVEQ